MSLLNTLAQLQDKRLKLQHDIKEHGDKHESWNDADRAKWDAMNADYDANLAEMEKINGQLKDQAAIRDRLDQINKQNSHFNGGKIDDFDRSSAGANLCKAQTKAFEGWILNQCDFDNLVTDDHRNAAKQCGISINSKNFHVKLVKDHPYQTVRRQALNALSGLDLPSGGALVGETLVGSIEKAMLAYGPMMQVADVIRTNGGEEMKWPTANDTSNTGRQIGESAAVTSTAEPTFGRISWFAHQFTSDEILVPYSLLQDSPFNLVQIIGDMLGERLGRILNTKCTTGTGAATPKGIVTAATTGVTAASATAIAFDELIDLEHSIDPSRRNLPGVGYMFHDNILKALRKLKDGASRYLWQAGANSGAPDTLNARPYWINQDMASTIATTASTILFGQLSQYKIRQVTDLRIYRLVERHRENDQDAFLAFMRADGNLLDAGDHPVKKLVQA